MSGKRIGYIRVSTPDQNPDRQLEGIELDKKFIDFVSGSSLLRPNLQHMLDYVREDDVIFVHSMDRLARNVIDLKKLISGLVSQKIKITFIKENLTFTHEKNPISDLMLYLMGAFAEFEREFMLERQREGIALAKQKGKYKGRVLKLKENELQKLRDLMNTRMSKTDIAKEMCISRDTLYTYLKRMNY